ncbi:MAG: GNAT family N-acetyltransferase [Methanomassiliicoccales archaeon]
MAQIVKLKKEDKGRVRALELFIIKEYMESILKRKWEELSPEFVEQLGATNDQAFKLYLESGLSYVAKEDDQIVGFIFAQKVQHMSNIPLSVWIESIGVHPSHRRQGIGYQLLRKVSLEAKKQGAKAVQSAIMPENAVSLMLHKKLGFFLDARRIAFLDLDTFK